jgi:uncharacterized protein
MLQFTDFAQIGGLRKTQDGYLVGDVLCARTGCQQYLASELGMAGGGMVTVYRPESAVFAKDSLATYVGKPVTLGHPPEQVTADNWKEYAVGDIGEEIARDGECVRASIKMMDGKAIRAVDGGIREVSMGYTTPIVIVDGIAPDGTPYQAVQTGPIKINHLAFVPEARGGKKLRIGDSANSWGVSPVTVSDKEERQMADQTRKIKIGDMTIETTDAGAISALQDHAEKLQTALDAASAAKTKAEEELGAEKAKVAAMEKEKMTDAQIDARVAARAALIGDAKGLYPDLQTDGLTDAAIRKAVVIKAHGDAFIDGMSDAAIDGAYRVVMAAKPKDALAGVKVDAKVVADSAAIYAARDADMSNAWKGK